MNEKECEVCRKLTKEKYKHLDEKVKALNVWRVLAIVFIIVSVVFAILYFASGQMFVEKTIENNIRIENADGSNENNVVTGEGSTISGTIKTESNIGIIIVFCAVIISGGIFGGCYYISKNKMFREIVIHPPLYSD